MYASNGTLGEHRHLCYSIMPALQNLSLGGFFFFFWLHIKENFLQGQTCQLLPLLPHAIYTFQNINKHLFLLCFNDHQWKSKQMFKHLKLFQGEEMHSLQFDSLLSSFSELLKPNLGNSVAIRDSGLPLVDSQQRKKNLIQA